MRCFLPVLLFFVLHGIHDPASAAESKAFVVTSDFSTGTLGAVDLATRVVSSDVASLGSDAVLRWHGGLLHVVNRFGADNIQVVDPAQGYATVRQFSVGNGSNPQDIAFVSPTKAYVSRYGSADLLVVNPSAANGQPMSSISLAAFADGDGLPEMSRMIRIGRYLFVACQRLTSFQPLNPSVIVVVDTETDAVVDVDPGTPGTQAIPLSTRNPITTFEYDRAQARLLIGCTGHFNALDGAVEGINPFTFQNLGPVVSEQQLGGDLTDIAWHTATHAYALVIQGNSNRLVTWNPSTGLKLATIFTASGGFSLPDCEINDRGELYVCKNPSMPSPGDLPGMLVFSTTTDALLAGPLYLGLPPIVVTFDHVTDEVTAAPEAPTAFRVAGPWPNPARGGVRLAVRLEAAADAEISVFDLAGRRVRTLASGRWEAGERAVEWDLSDAAGRPVPTGLYLVRARIGDRLVVRRLTVLN